ncbi:hypothetical protein BGZ93_008943 [Podila epicladia]|nr:hypothetical protein BGZ93_008943 [Podila epicladia]
MVNAIRRIYLMDIPLIVDAICEYLNLEDILHCRQVSTARFTFFNPHRWKTVTFANLSEKHTIEILQNTPRIRVLTADLQDPELLVNNSFTGQCTYLTDLTCTSFGYMWNTWCQPYSPRTNALFLLETNPKLETVEIDKSAHAVFHYFVPRVIAAMSRHSCLTTLRIRGTRTGDASFLPLLKLCPQVQDLHLPLSLVEGPIQYLATILEHCPKLRFLGHREALWEFHLNPEDDMALFRSLRRTFLSRIPRLDLVVGESDDQGHDVLRELGQPMGMAGQQQTPPLSNNPLEVLNLEYNDAWWPALDFGTCALASLPNLRQFSSFASRREQSKALSTNTPLRVHGYTQDGSNIRGELYHGETSLQDLVESPVWPSHNLQLLRFRIVDGYERQWDAPTESKQDQVTRVSKLFYQLFRRLYTHAARDPQTGTLALQLSLTWASPSFQLPLETGLQAMWVQGLFGMEDDNEEKENEEPLSMTKADAAWMCLPWPTIAEVRQITLQQHLEQVASTCQRETPKPTHSQRSILSYSAQGWIHSCSDNGRRYHHDGCELDEDAACAQVDEFSLPWDRDGLEQSATAAEAAGRVGGSTLVHQHEKI